MRKGRGINHFWEVRKYRGDLALYAYCSCGFLYPCSSNKKKEDGTLSFEQEITMLYPYCPNCGAHKKSYNVVPRKMNKEFPWM